MEIMTDKQIENLSETFQKQLKELSDIDFIKSPFGIEGLNNLHRQILEIENNKNITQKEAEIKNLINNFRSKDGKNFQQYRQEISSQLSEFMSVKNLKEFNSMISEAVKKLEKNPYWQSLNHPQKHFNANKIELTLPEKRAGRCFRAKLEDNTYKDVVTINPLGFSQWLNNKNIHSKEDKIACLETHIIHELTHGDQYNRIVDQNGISADFPPTDKMPSLVSTPQAPTKKTQSKDDNVLLMDALWEADTRSTAYKALSVENISNEMKEKIMQMQLQFSISGVKQEKPHGNNHKEVFFVTLKNYLTAIKQFMPQAKLEFSNETKNLINHIYDAKKYGKYEDFVHEIKKTIQEINHPQKESKNKQQLIQAKIQKLKNHLSPQKKKEIKPQYNAILEKYIKAQKQYQ